MDVTLKVECIVRCIHLVMGALRVGWTDDHENGSLPGSDLLMPALIFVLLHAQPPVVHSNVEYCLYYWSQNDGSSGWFQFCLTTFASAVAFLAQIENSSFTLDPTKDKDLCTT